MSVHHGVRAGTTGPTCTCITCTCDGCGVRGGGYGVIQGHPQCDPCYTLVADTTSHRLDQGCGQGRAMARLLTCHRHNDGITVFDLYSIDHAHPCVHHLTQIWGWRVWVWVGVGRHACLCQNDGNIVITTNFVTDQSGRRGMWASCQRSRVSGIGGVVGLLSGVLPLLPFRPSAPSLSYTSPLSLLPSAMSLHKMGGTQWAACCSCVRW